MNKNFFFKPSLSLLMFFCLSSYYLHAQDSILLRKNLLKSFVFKGNHICFDFSVLSTFKAQLNQQTGNYPVSTAAAPGLLLSFKYKINFNNHYSLLTGPEAIITGRNLIVSFNKNDFSPPLIKDYKLGNKDTYAGDLVLSLPVLLERRVFYANTKYFFVNGGVRLNFSTGADFDNFSIYLQNINNGYVNAGEINVYANNNARPWFSFPLNAGHSWLLKNNNLLGVVLCSNISFTNYVDGTYQITIPNQPVTAGRYSSTGSYIGVSFLYLFTSANYRIRKAYEKIKNQL